MTDPVHSIAPPAVPPKEDPETLVLRGRPRPVVRFRRGLVVGLAGAVAAGLIGIAWVALEPPSLRLAGPESGEGEPLQGGVPQALADAPGSYGEVPELGLRSFLPIGEQSGGTGHRACSAHAGKLPRSDRALGRQRR